MALSRQETSVKNSGRVNQKARTRSALLDAAVALLREGRMPSVPDAAERAMVSVATAYRYFPTAEDLRTEASIEAADFDGMRHEIDAAIDAAGPNPEARLDALVMTLGWRMLENQLPFRTMTRLAHERWFVGETAVTGEPVREGRRARWIAQVVEPLAETLTEEEMRVLVNALNVSIGTEAMISLVDVAHLEVEEAKRVLLQTNRWILAGALADAKKRARRKT